jgi:L-gulono-1,4-lactone dehydrogenase
MSYRLFTNFGGNQKFTPTRVVTPRTDAELLEVLHECRGRQIRVIGRLHSWSEAAVTDDVMVDLRHFQDVKVELRDGKHWVTAGGGCQIKRLLAELKRQDAGTLPSLGLITEQTIAGAISTATHGSGKPSMSHFVDKILIATYDPATGEPTIRTINEGDELRAARCALGTLGVIVSVGFWSRPKYNVEEFFQRYDDIESVLAKEDEYPLQQFFLMPWHWRYFAQHRRETTQPRGGWATLYRIYFFLQFDIGLHLLVLLTPRFIRSPWLVRRLCQHLTPRLVIQNWKVIDDSSRMLVMEHELFRHIECEVFVPRSRLVEAADFVVQMLQHFGGEAAALDTKTREQLQGMGLLRDIDQQAGSYTHHYPICLRRVLPDDTLISMTGSSTEPYYAVSFISYARLNDRQGFLAFSEILSRAMGAMYGARPHWGKVCPLSAAEVERLYPQLPKFREIVRGSDPEGVFRNDWLNRMFFAESAEARSTPTSHPS